MSARGRVTAAVMAGLLAPFSASAASCRVSPPNCVSGCSIEWDGTPTKDANPAQLITAHVAELRSCLDWALDTAGLEPFPWKKQTTGKSELAVRLAEAAEMDVAISSVCARNGKPSVIGLAARARKMKGVPIAEARLAIMACAWRGRPGKPEVTALWSASGPRNRPLAFGYKTANAKSAVVERCRLSGSCETQTPACDEYVSMPWSGPPKYASANAPRGDGGCCFRYRARACGDADCSDWAYASACYQ